jgi:hypothetical protein
MITYYVSTREVFSLDTAHQGKFYFEAITHMNNVFLLLRDCFTVRSDNIGYPYHKACLAKKLKLPLDDIHR